MISDVKSLQQQLCAAFCADVRVSVKKDFIRVSLPLISRDGDHQTVYLKRGNGGWRVSDMGSTLMRLSYENDINSLLTGPRGKLFEQILLESGTKEDDGEIYTEVQADRLLNGLFQIGQCASRLEDLGLWSRSRVESTFKDDLKSILLDVISSENLVEDYVVPHIENANLYPIDFYIKTSSRPLYLFGVNTADRARISTIVMQHLIQNSHDFDSFVVCSDFYSLPQADGARLMNAANDMVQSIDNVIDLKRKLKHRIAS